MAAEWGNWGVGGEPRARFPRPLPPPEGEGEARGGSGGGSPHRGRGRGKPGGGTGEQSFIRGSAWFGAVFLPGFGRAWPHSRMLRTGALAARSCLRAQSRLLSTAPKPQRLPAQLEGVLSRFRASQGPKAQKEEGAARLVEDFERLQSPFAVHFVRRRQD